MYNSEFIPPPNDPLAIEVFIGLKEFNGLPSRYLPATLANQLAAAIASGATVFQLLNEAGKQICERAFPGERDGEFANVLAWTAVKIRNSHWKVRDIVDVNWIPWEQRRIGGYYGLPPRDFRQAVYTASEFAGYRAARCSARWCVGESFLQQRGPVLDERQRNG